MRTIWKFPLSGKTKQSLQVPAQSLPLAVQMQGSTPCIWFEVEDTKPSELRDVYVFGAGHDMAELPEDFAYVGTIQIQMFVFHVYA